MKMKLALGSKRQAMLFGALALVLVLAVVRWRPGSAAVRARVERLRFEPRDGPGAPPRRRTSRRRPRREAAAGPRRKK